MDVTRLNPTVGWTAGGLVSSAGDLTTFLRALAGGRLLNPDALRAMRTTVSMGQTGQDYGLGLVRLESPCGRIEGHDGSIPGYRAFALTTADGRRQVALVANLGEGSFTPRAATAYQAALRVAICPGA
jgi:D-alanyl-D-alanine carboxypeptidase